VFRGMFATVMYRLYIDATRGYPLHCRRKGRELRVPERTIYG
jgi:hypothetical protein